MSHLGPITKTIGILSTMVWLSRLGRSVARKINRSICSLNKNGNSVGSHRIDTMVNLNLQYRIIAHLLLNSKIFLESLKFALI